jgi:hypothetical protein
MLVPFSPIRQTIDDLIQEANTCTVNGNDFYDLVAELEGIDLWERRDCRQDNEYRCAEYLVGTLMNEPWFWGKARNAPASLWTRPVKYLGGRGYVTVTVPQMGDVIAYGQAKNGSIEIQHWGMWVSGEVISKFNDGHAFLHRPEMVPNEYGDRAVFFRRLTRLQQLPAAYNT